MESELKALAELPLERPTPPVHAPAP